MWPYGSVRTESTEWGGFVCVGQSLLTIDEPRAQELVAYQTKVLTALGINYGSSHGEVKWHEGEPVLVEVGSRCHGAEGFWMPVADSVYGYNQVECTIDSYEKRPDNFVSIPETPFERKAWGYLLFFVLFKDGIFHEVNPAMMGEIQSMKSFCI